MKSSVVFTLGLAAIATAQSNLPTFPESVKDLPSCSYSALADAMNDAGCSTGNINADTFNCMCVQHLGSIVGAVALKANGNCGDFPTNYGTMCGLYESQPSSSDLDAGVTALKNEIGGKFSGGSAPTTAAASSGTAAASGGSAAATSPGTSNPSTTSSHGLAAAPTAVKIAEILGPVAAVIALLA